MNDDMLWLVYEQCSKQTLDALLRIMSVPEYPVFDLTVIILQADYETGCACQALSNRCWSNPPRPQPV